MLNTGNLAITSDMVPITRIIAWYKSPGGAVVADSIVVHVERKCHSDVCIQFCPTMAQKYKPCHNLKILYTATPHPCLTKLYSPKILVAETSILPVVRRIFGGLYLWAIVCTCGPSCVCTCGPSCVCTCGPSCVCTCGPSYCPGLMSKPRRVMLRNATNSNSQSAPIPPNVHVCLLIKVLAW